METADKYLILTVASVLIAGTAVSIFTTEPAYFGFGLGAVGGAAAAYVLKGDVGQRFNDEEYEPEPAPRQRTTRSAPKRGMEKSKVEEAMERLKERQRYEEVKNYEGQRTLNNIPPPVERPPRENPHRTFSINTPDVQGRPPRFTTKIR